MDRKVDLRSSMDGADVPQSAGAWIVRCVQASVFVRLDDPSKPYSMRASDFAQRLPTPSPRPALAVHAPGSLAAAPQGL